MVVTIIRRQSGPSIKQAIKREQIEISKTGIHPNPIVNQAIDEIQSNETVSGNGTAPASTTVPYLLKKRRELSQGDEDADRARSTHR